MSFTKAFLTSCSIGTKLDALVQSVDSQAYPTDDVQAFVKDQLQELRTDMLRFEEVAADGRKAQEANATLNQKVEAEQRHTLQLTEQIRDLQRNEKDLKARQVQLECQLANANEIIRVQDPEPSALNKEIADLQQRLKSVEKERTAKEAEVADLGRKMEKRNRKLADYDVSDFTTTSCAF